jgi:hypothetical protein
MNEYKPSFKKNYIISQITDKIDEINNLGRAGSMSPLRSSRGKLDGLKKDLFVEFFANNHENRNVELSQITNRMSVYSDDSIKAETSGTFKRKINDLMNTLNKSNGIKETSRIQK